MLYSRNCPDCSSGKTSMWSCKRCRGTGSVPYTSYTSPSCLMCGGSGIRGSVQCDSCKGAGYYFSKDNDTTIISSSYSTPQQFSNVSHETSYGNGGARNNDDSIIGGVLTLIAFSFFCYVFFVGITSKQPSDEVSIFFINDNSCIGTYHFVLDGKQTRSNEKVLMIQNIPKGTLSYTIDAENLCQSALYLYNGSGTLNIKPNHVYAIGFDETENDDWILKVEDVTNREGIYEHVQELLQ